MSEAPERIVPSCVEALESYQQADMDGIMVLASRQAIHETIDAYWARVRTCEELEAALSLRTNLHGEATYLINKLEAQLAKAVRFLNGLDRHGVYTTDELEDLLAELKGQNQ